MAALPVVLRWHDILALLWRVDLPFAVAWLLQSTGTSPPPSEGVAYQQEGTWPPSGGEVLCAGSFTSLLGLISSCQVTAPKLSDGLLVGRQKCSGITQKVSWACICLSPRSPPAWLPNPKKWIIYLICLRMSPALGAKYHSCHSSASTALLQGSCFLSALLLAFLFGGEMGDVSTLGMGQQHWFNLVFLSYLFIQLLVLWVTSRVSDSHLWMYSNLWI